MALAFNMVNPSEAILGGLKTGAVLEQQQLESQAAQAKQAQALAMQTDLARLYTNPNAGHTDYAAVMTKYPAMAENIGKAFKVLDEGKQRTALDFGSRVYGALQSGNTELAVQMMEERAKADPSQAQHLGVLAQVTKADPRAGKVMWATTMAGMLGPDKFATAFPAIMGEQRAQEQAPADLRKKEADAAAAESDATIKGEQAKLAPQAALLDLQKKGWDVEKIKQDIQIAREDNRIKAMQAAISRESNDLKREELRLKVQEARDKQAESIRTKAAEVESARFNIDNFLNNADRILAAAVGKDGKPTSTLRAAAGPVDSRIPTVQRDVADLEALLETAGSQAFLSQIPNVKGMGQLSNAEGEKLQAALTNLSLRQSPEQLVANVREAQRLLLKARKNVSARYGVPESVPDTPAAGGNASEIDALLKKYGG